MGDIPIPAVALLLEDALSSMVTLSLRETFVSAIILAFTFEAAQAVRVVLAMVLVPALGLVTVELEGEKVSVNGIKKLTGGRYVKSKSVAALLVGPSESMYPRMSSEGVSPRVEEDA